MVSVPSFMIASRLLAPIGVASNARGVGEGGTRRVVVGQSMAVSSGSTPASQNAAAAWRMISPLTHPTF
jgi:hypothetical protein